MLDGPVEGKKKVKWKESMTSLHAHIHHVAHHDINVKTPT